MTLVLAVSAAGWAMLMAVAPLLQVRRMLLRRSSADVSVAYLAILLPGFALWVAYGIASDDLALVAPNIVAFIVASATLGCAIHLRHRPPRTSRRRTRKINEVGSSTVLVDPGHDG